jgi:hypothetical protein
MREAVREMKELVRTRVDEWTMNAPNHDIARRSP